MKNKKGFIVCLAAIAVLAAADLAMSLTNTVQRELHMIICVLIGAFLGAALSFGRKKK